MTKLKVFAKLPSLHEGNFMKKTLIIIVALALMGCGKPAKEKEFKAMEERAAQTMAQEIHNGKTWDYYTSELPNEITMQTWRLVDEGAIYKSPYIELLVQKFSDGRNRVVLMAENAEFSCKNEACPFIAKFDNEEHVFTFDASSMPPNRQNMMLVLDSELPKFIEKLKQSEKLSINGDFFPASLYGRTFNTKGLNDLDISP